MKRGVDFEMEFRRGLKRLPGWFERWPNRRFAQKSPADYVGLYNGHFIAVECKSIRGVRFPTSNLKSHQNASLQLINDNGGVSFVALRFKAGRGKYHCFLINYSDYVPFVRGKKSIALRDAERNFCELQYLTNEEGYKYWDAAPILDLSE